MLEINKPDEFEFVDENSSIAVAVAAFTDNGVDVVAVVSYPTNLP